MSATTDYPVTSLQDGFAAYLHPNCADCTSNGHDARAHAAATGSVGNIYGDGTHRAAWARESAPAARDMLARAELSDELRELGMPDEANPDRQTEGDDDPLWLLDWKGRGSRYVRASMVRNLFPSVMQPVPGGLTRAQFDRLPKYARDALTALQRDVDSGRRRD